MLAGQRRAAALRRRRAPIVLPSSVKIVTEGDSLTEGLGSSGTGWPGRAIPGRLAVGPAYTLANVATSGITVNAGNGIAGGYDQRGVASGYDAGKALNLVAVMGGTNDGAVGERVALYRGLRAFIRRARATGYQRVVVGTLIARADGTGPGPKNQYFDGDTLPLNADIRALWNSDLDADGLIDWAAHPRFATATAAQDIGFYTNVPPPWLHPNDAGYEAMAAIAAPVIDAAVAAPGVRAATPATWSFHDCSQFLQLSNANRTVSFANGFADATVRGLPGRSAGKSYWEMSFDSAGATAHGICSRAFEGSIWGSNSYVSNSPYALGAGYGFNNGGFNDSGVFFNGAKVASLPDYASTGEVWQYALDMDHRRFWLRRAGNDWNGSASADPASNAGGIDVAALGVPIHPLAYLRTAGGQITARFAAGQMTGAIPSGFAPLGG